MTLRRLSLDLTQLARRSLMLDEQALQRFTAPVLWSKWPKDAALAASTAAESAAAAWAMPHGPLREASPLKYVSDYTFRDALISGETVLVKGAWLAAHALSGSLLPR